MQQKIYLTLNGILYLVFGIWCTVAPDFTSKAVGLQPIGAHGFSEFIAVYGGLEFGTGIFFICCAIIRNLDNAGILFGMCFYLSIVVFRTVAIFQVGIDIGNAINFYAAEIFLAAWSTRLFSKLGSLNRN